MRITALEPFRLPDTSTAVVGTTYTVPDQFGQERVGEGRASDPDAASAPGRLIPVVVDQALNKLFGGSTELSVGASATSLVTPSGVAAGNFAAPLLVGNDAPPLSFFNKKKSLGIYSTAAAAHKTLTGGATLLDDYLDAFTGNTPGGSYPNNNGVSPVMRIGSGGAATVIPSTTAGTAQDLTGCNVYIRFKVLTGGTKGPGSVNMGIRLYTGSTVNSGSANYLSCAVTNWNPTFEWQTLGFAIEDFAVAGTAQLTDITAITHAGARCGGISTSTDIELGDIFFCPKQLTKGAVVISFDDCRADTWTQAKYELDKRGFVGTLFPGAIATVLRPSTDQFQMSVNQIQKICRACWWQVAGQAWESESPTYTVDTAMSSMAQQKGFMKRIGLWGAKLASFFSNYGPDVQEAKPAFQANFPWGMRGFNIGSDGGINAKAVLPEVFPIADQNYIRALGVDLNANSLASLQNFLSYTAASKSIAILVFHGIDAANSTQFAKFTGLLDWLDSNRATTEVATLERFVQLGYASPM